MFLERGIQKCHHSAAYEPDSERLCTGMAYFCGFMRTLRGICEPQEHRDFFDNYIDIRTYGNLNYPPYGREGIHRPHVVLWR